MHIVCDDSIFQNIRILVRSLNFCIYFFDAACLHYCIYNVDVMWVHTNALMQYEKKFKEFMQWAGMYVYKGGSKIDNALV